VVGAVAPMSLARVLMSKDGKIVPVDLNFNRTDS
jgi:hypothetical protein